MATVKFHYQLIGRFPDFREKLMLPVNKFHLSCLINHFPGMRNCAYWWETRNIASVHSWNNFSIHKNLVVIARVRSNRIFYQSPIVDELNKKRGCPKKYGERFNLADVETEAVKINT